MLRYIELVLTSAPQNTKAAQNASKEGSGRCSRLVNAGL